MNLMIMRHGEAEPYAGETTDASRSLTNFGREYVHKVAQELVKAGANRGEIDLILVSPYLRTQQTADIVMDNLGQKPLRKTCNWLLSESSVQTACEELEAIRYLNPDNILIVSHMPLVSLLLEYLSGDRLALGPANVALVELEYFEREQGVCSWIA
jgi:phosphohistidine phosphatase